MGGHTNFMQNMTKMMKKIIWPKSVALIFTAAFSEIYQWVARKNAGDTVSI